MMRSALAQSYPVAEDEKAPAWRRDRGGKVARCIEGPDPTSGHRVVFFGVGDNAGRVATNLSGVVTRGPGWPLSLTSQ